MANGLPMRVCPGTCRKPRADSIYPGSQPRGACQCCGATVRLSKRLTARKHFIVDTRWGEAEAGKDA